MKISSENMDEPNLKEAVKAADLDPVHVNIKKLIRRGEKLVKTQENELYNEEVSAKGQMGNIYYYYYVTVFQIVLVAVFGLYQLYSFRTFLLEKVI